MGLQSIMDVEEAAKKWNLTPGHVKNLCAQGKLVARKFSSVWILEKDQPAPAGFAPKECVSCGDYFEPKHPAQKYCSINCKYDFKSRTNCQNEE